VLQEMQLRPCLASLLVALSTAPLTALAASFSPSSITRSIDLGGALTRSTTIYTLQHTPQSDDSATDFTLTFDTDQKPGFVEAHVGKSGSRKLVEIREEVQR